MQAPLRTVLQIERRHHTRERSPGWEENRATDRTCREIRSLTIAASSFAVQNRAARHSVAPNQPQMRRRAAQEMHFPRSPITS